LDVAKKLTLTVVEPGAIGIVPPRKLGKAGATLWAAVQKEYGITDIGGTELLAQICGATDRLEAIAESISTEGELIVTRSGMRANPLIREETQLRAFVCRTLQKLGITQEPIKPIGRPPGSPGWTA
jgi:hypothetical protein